MSLAKQTMQLRAVSSLVQLKRGKHGYPGAAYFPGKWGVSGHVINRAPTTRMPLWQKMTFGMVWLVGMFTYPFYVTYKMYDWDRLDENM